MRRRHQTRPVFCSVALLLSSFFLLPQGSCARQCTPAFISSLLFHGPFTRNACSSYSRTGLNPRVAASSATCNDGDRSRIPESLVQSLDLAPMIRALSEYAGTRRGREAILGLIGEERNAQRPSTVSESTDYVSSKRQRVAREVQAKIKQDSELSLARTSLAPIAASAERARTEYELVEQATLALEGGNSLAVPPLYGATASPMDTETIIDTDDDEWLVLSLDDWTLEHVLQADQVVQTLLRVHEWGGSSETQTWTPGLSEMAQAIPEASLRTVHQEIQGAVEIVTKRSFVNSQPMTYKFQLSEERFPSLRFLREKEAKLQDVIEKELKAALRKLKGSPEVLECQGRMVLCLPKAQISADIGIIRGTTDNGRRCYVEPRSIVKLGDDLAAIQKELISMETEIELGLKASVQQASVDIDQGIHIMARLDVIFAKAAFGTALNGSIPKVGHEGLILVKQFVHPVLKLQKVVSAEVPVPIDLLLSPDQGTQALIISGANGGGKSLALKSFGLACQVAKLAIPVPQAPKASSSVPPRVDFFDNILAEVGDHQSVLEGESTLMAKLNAFSSIIEYVVARNRSTPESSLVLLDELGSGTDPAAGGAIAQAVLEKLLESEECRVVATTHSPRLKALSYNSAQFNCATVLLRNDPNSEFMQPSYELAYGNIGDSYALGAASRCFPPLPEDVLARASSLMASAPTEQDEDASYLRALTLSLEAEKESTLIAKHAWEKSTRELQACRTAMIQLAETYSDHLKSVEDRMQDIFRELRDDKSKDAVEVVGETLEILQVVKKKVKTEEDMLKERGLVKVSPDYEFHEGESVVIVAPGELEGTTATIVAMDSQNKNYVTIVPSLMNEWDDPFFTLDRKPGDKTIKALVVKRSEVAVWDMNGVWDDIDSYGGAENPATSVREARQSLTGLLSTLKSSLKGTRPIHSDSLSQGNSFRSARQRKAARTKRKKK